MPRKKITTWKVDVMVFPPPKVEDQGDAAAVLNMTKLAAMTGSVSTDDKFSDGKPKELTFERVEGDEITDAMEGGWNLARMDHPNSKVVVLKAIRN